MSNLMHFQDSELFTFPLKEDAKTKMLNTSSKRNLNFITQ